MSGLQRFNTALACALSVLFLMVSGASALDFSKTIKEVRVEGNKRANSSTIAFYIHTKPGDTYSLQKVRADVRRIFNLGYFDNIRVEAEEEGDEVVLTFHVKEKPFVKSVAIKGGKEVPKQDLEALILMKKGTYYQEHILRRDVRKIKEKYRKKGYYFTRVETKATPAGNHQVDVAYTIKENQQIKITRVNFRGNDYLKDYDLQGVMETSSIGFWSFMSEDGNFDREILKTDRLRLESLYRDHGFIKAVVDEPKVEIDREEGRIMITFDITEGDQFFVGKITAEGDDVFTAEEILAKVKLKEGEPFNQSAFRESLFGITEMYADKGYAYANPVPDIKEKPEEKIVDIHLKVEPGHKVYIGRITVTGNDKTRENVIRREFRIHEGELFSGTKMKRTRQRLGNTQFFESVNISQRSGANPELMDLDVHVIERSTGSIKAGVGYNSADNVTYQLSIAEDNVFGSGRAVQLTAEKSDLREYYYIDLTEPRWLNRDIYLNFQASSKGDDFITYQSYQKAVSATVGRNLTEYSELRLKYQLERTRIVITDPEDIGTFLESMAGTNTSSSLSPIYIVNTLDNNLFPSTGYKTRYAVEGAGGPLGGELDYYKLFASASRYWKASDNLVLSIRADAKYAKGYSGQTLPIYKNFFLGGSQFRGFQFDDVGPTDDNGDGIGGDTSLLTSLEVHYSFSHTVRGVLFYDRGQVYGEIGNLEKTTDKRFDLNNMRHSYGFGLQMLTPVGPITMSWGFKLDRQTGEAPMQFNLMIGGAAF